LDDNFADHPKVKNLSDQAYRLFVDLANYMGRYNTDGRLTFAEVEDHKNAEYALELVECGLWEETDLGFYVPGFLERNPSKAKVDSERGKARERKERWNERRSAQRSERATERPPRPDPSRPEGSRDGSPVTTPDPDLPPPEQVKANVPKVREIRDHLKAVTG
jgi:hypothetical protein